MRWQFDRAAGRTATILREHFYQLNQIVLGKRAFCDTQLFQKNYPQMSQ
jgi:hypothetical protein